ncbi:hypothetical protein GmHk_13G037543 [Glycine max]|nr:hypothetical protein GmHk_13G037543 [Glycine max]
MHCAIGLLFRHRKGSGDEDEVPVMTKLAWDATRDGGCSVVCRYLAFSFGEGFHRGSPMVKQWFCNNFSDLKKLKGRKKSERKTPSSW